jgi:hypothetical protein
MKKLRRRIRRESYLPAQQFNKKKQIPSLLPLGDLLLLLVPRIALGHRLIPALLLLRVGSALMVLQLLVGVERLMADSASLLLVLVLRHELPPACDFKLLLLFQLFCCL